jgi:hypothetical protein
MNIIKKKPVALKNEPLKWRQMSEEMNKRGLHRTAGEKLSVMSAHGEFYKIMEKLSTEVWKYYHPGEDPRDADNKKMIKNIARSDYFAELVQGALDGTFNK